MRHIIVLGALVALAACTGGDPTGPSKVTSPGNPVVNDPIPPPPPPVRTITFKVYGPTPVGEPLVSDTNNFMLVVRSGSWSDSVLTKGQSQLKFPTITPDSVFITIPGNEDYPTVIAQMPKDVFDAQNGTVGIIRIPRKWTIRKGVYAGLQTTTDLVRPFVKTPLPDNTSFYRRTGNDSIGYWYPSLGWNPASLPAKLWIDADSSFQVYGTSPNEEDSARIGTGLDELAKLIGWTPFSMSSAVNGGVIKVLLKNSGNPSAGVMVGPSDEIYGGVYYGSMQNRWRNPNEVIHEGIHLLGFGHTCAWSGYMPTGCVWTDSTVDGRHFDVAYVELWYAVNNTRRLTGSVVHWGENLNGTLQDLGRPTVKVLYKDPYR